MCHSNRSPPEERRGITSFEVLATLCVIALLVALLLPAMEDVRDGHRPRCRNNLKHIALALHNYHDTYGSFPPAMTVDADGRPLHSWRTLILPFLDESALYKSINLSKPWDDPVNADALAKAPAVFRCPQYDGRSELTTYVALVGPYAAFESHEGRALKEITDGTSNTVLVIEVSTDAAVPWMSPEDGGTDFLARFNDQMALSHEGGVNAVIADGSVRFLAVDLATESRTALMTINGGETVDAF